MSLKEQIVREVEHLPETELQHVADYLAFLKFRARRRKAPAQLPDAASLATLYAEFADEDQALAEERMADYAQALAVEDVR